MRQTRSFYLLLVVIILLIPFTIYGQAYNQPESAVYDAANDRYLISNTGDGNAGSGDIISVPRLNPTNLSYYKQGAVKSIRGIVIAGTTLYAAATANDDTQVLLAIILATGVIQKSVTIVGGNFVNDVSADAAGNVYLSDSNNIYKFDPTTGTYTTFLANTSANGLFVDDANNRLIFTDDSPAIGSAISAIDLTTKATTQLIANTFRSLDGLTVDHIGNYYVSSWGDPNAIYRYDANFTTSVLASNHAGKGVADIFFDTVNKVMVAPNMAANTVDFIPFAQLDTDEAKSSIPKTFQLHQNYPNPFNPTTTISYDINEESLVNIAVYNLLGSEVVQMINNVEQPGAKSVIWDGRDAEGNLVKAGVYIYKLNVGANSQTKKMVLLK